MYYSVCFYNHSLKKFLCNLDSFSPRLIRENILSINTSATWASYIFIAQDYKVLVPMWKSLLCRYRIMKLLLIMSSMLNIIHSTQDRTFKNNLFFIQFLSLHYWFKNKTKVYYMNFYPNLR